jgi:hypothetical protein
MNLNFLKIHFEEIGRNLFFFGLTLNHLNVNLNEYVK